MQFQANGAALGAPVTLVGGVAHLTTTLPVTAGNVAITASYAGDFYNAEGTSVVPVLVTVGTPPAVSVRAVPMWAEFVLAATILGIAGTCRTTLPRCMASARLRRVSRSC